MSSSVVGGGDGDLFHAVLVWRCKLLLWSFLVLSCSAVRLRLIWSKLLSSESLRAPPFGAVGGSSFCRSACPSSELTRYCGMLSAAALSLTRTAPLEPRAYGTLPLTGAVDIWCVSVARVCPSGLLHVLCCFSGRCMFCTLLAVYRGCECWRCRCCCCCCCWWFLCCLMFLLLPQ